MLIPLLFVSAAMATDPALRPITLFREGEGGYHNYRIPAVIRTSRNTILAFCEGRQNAHGPSNDSGEINLLVRRSTDGGNTFDPPRVVWADGQNTCGNPCPVVDRSTGKIWLLATHNLGEDTERQITLGTAHGTRTVWVSSSSDDGVTWMPFREITGDVKKPDWASGGRLLLNMRNMTPPRGETGHLNRGIALSDDGGATFGPARFDPTLIEPRCQGSILRYCWPEQGKSRIFFCNPASTRRREALTVRLSYDEAATWPVSKVIVAGPAGYSSLVALGDGSIGLLYEAGVKNPYERIDFVRFGLDWLKDGKHQGK